MKTTLLFSIVLAALLSVQWVMPMSILAQTTNSIDTAQRGMLRRPDPARLEALKAKIEELKYQRIKTSLGLDDEQARKFFEQYKPVERDIQELVKKRNEAMKALQEATSSGKPNAEIEPKLNEIRDLTAAIQQRQVQLDQNLKPILTPVQRARLLVFEQEFNHRVRQQIDKRKFLNNHPLIRNRLQQFRLQRRLQKKLNHR